MVAVIVVAVVVLGIVLVEVVVLVVVEVVVVVLLLIVVVIVVMAELEHLARSTLCSDHCSGSGELHLHLHGQQVVVVEKRQPHVLHSGPQHSLARTPREQPGNSEEWSTFLTNRTSIFSASNMTVHPTKNMLTQA